MGRPLGVNSSKERERYVDESWDLLIKYGGCVWLLLGLGGGRQDAVQAQVHGRGAIVIRPASGEK